VTRRKSSSPPATWASSEFYSIISPFWPSSRQGNFVIAGQHVEHIAVSGGYAEVLPTKVTVLATTAERAQDIDVERARAAKERAEHRLKERQEQTDFARAEVALKRALASSSRREGQSLLLSRDLRFDETSRPDSRACLSFLTSRVSHP